MKKLKSYISLLAAITLMAACANIQAPSGGPIDTIPPAILDTFPANSTLNFTDNEIVLEFSKYMNKNSVIENFYVLPNSKMEFDWSGKELSITFAEPLKENTTYSINIGSDYTDLKNNKPENAFNLIFSTGNVIDSGLIQGKIITDKPQGLFVYAYNISNILADTLNPFKTIPDYKVQIGQNGDYKINGLPDGKYRLFAVLDKFKDGIISDGQDLYACSYNDATVTFGKANDLFFRFGANADIAKPKLFSAGAATNRKINLFMSELVDSSSISAFAIVDSLTNEEIPTMIAYRDVMTNNQINIITSEDLPADRKFIVFQKDSSTFISDTSGNKLAFPSDSVVFLSTKQADSSLFKLLGKSIKDSAAFIPVSSTFNFAFSEPIDTLYSEFIKFSFANDSAAIPFAARVINNNYLSIKSVKDLSFNADLKIEINALSIKTKFGVKSIDSLIILNFKTEDSRTNGALSGTLIDSSETNSPKIIFLVPEFSGEIYEINVGKDGKWAIDNIKPGNYEAIIIDDANNNGKYDFGKLYPFAFAEKFFLSDVKIQAKSRWAVENIVFRVGK